MPPFDTIVTIVAVVLVVFIVRDFVMPLDQWSNMGSKCHSCIQEQMHQLCHQKHADGYLDDLGDPLFNVREAAKQCEALEDHLEHPHKRCQDCIRKHFLMVEMLLEEAISLDRYKRHDALLTGKPQKVRKIISEFNEFKDYTRTAQCIRDLRKQFVNASFETV